MSDRSPETQRLSPSDRSRLETAPREEKGLNERSPQSWRAVELAAQRQNAEAWIHEAVKPLEFGQFIAWAHLHPTTRQTDAISSVHRVDEGGELTTCGEPIPPVPLRFPLSDALIRTMPHCRLCEVEYASRQGRAA